MDYERINNELEQLPQYIDSISKLTEKLKKEEQILKKYSAYNEKANYEECLSSIHSILDKLTEETMKKNALLNDFLDYIKGEPNSDKIILIERLVMGETWDDIAMKHKYSQSGIYKKRKSLYQKLQKRFFTQKDNED